MRRRFLGESSETDSPQIAPVSVGKRGGKFGNQNAKKQKT
jgi:hypothetical protein